MSDPTAPLAAGTPAPDFTLPHAPGQTISLSDFRGKPVVLAFYPADWSDTCSDQMSSLNEHLAEFKQHGAELIGISVDGMFCHAAFRKARGLSFTLLADYEPKGAVSRQYGAYHREWGSSARALFVIDKDGVIRWSHLSPMDDDPGADGILRALESLEVV